MALKGTDSKNIAIKKILETFEGSFTYDKEIRIPFIENGEQIQLKCVLTCAKINVGENDDIAIPGGNASSEINFTGVEGQTSSISASPQEKENIKRLMDILNL